MWLFDTFCDLFPHFSQFCDHSLLSASVWSCFLSGSVQDLPISCTENLILFIRSCFCSKRARFVVESEKVWQQRKRKWSPGKLHAALPAVAAGFGVRPAAVPQCFCLIALPILLTIPYRICPFPVRNAWFFPFRTGLRLFLYGMFVLACFEQVCPLNLLVLQEFC